MMNEDDKNFQKTQMLFTLKLEGVRNKYSVLPIFSGLFVAILAVGVSSDIFEINAQVKFMASILLLLSVTSIHIYLQEALNLSISASDALDKNLGKTPSNESLNLLQSFIYVLTDKIDGVKKNRTIFQRFSSQFPTYAVLILWLVVTLMIFEIWS